MVDDNLTLVLDDAREQMDSSIQHLRAELSTIRAGRATPAMLETIKVDYYGSITPLSQMASVSAPQHDLLTIQPWDKSALGPIEKAIRQGVGMNPSNDGVMIRIPVPPPSEERRRELVKVARAKGEEAKISVRNVRRTCKDDIKRTQKDENLSEDMGFEAEAELQKLTDDYTAKIENVMKRKEAEIMEV